METKTFPTLVVASLLTGVGLCNAPFSKVHELAEHLLGGPVWTHEFVHGPTMDAIVEEGRRQFPDMPTAVDAKADYVAAAAKATAAYGETVTVAKGTHGRRENPVQTLQALTDKPIIVVEG